MTEDGRACCWSGGHSVTTTEKDKSEVVMQERWFSIVEISRTTDSGSVESGGGVVCSIAVLSERKREFNGEVRRNVDMDLNLVSYIVQVDA